MTSAHSMQTSQPRSGACRRPLRITLGATLLLASGALTACESSEKLQSPSVLTAPYEGRQVWAVVPMMNESGVSIVRTDRVADLFAEQAEEIEGIAVIPVNRVLAGMRRLEMNGISTPGQAMTLMNLLGADGLIVGTITTYDPYPPFKLGAAVQLYRRSWAGASSEFDPVRFSRASTDHAAPGAMTTNEPVAQASGVFDASNHQTLFWLDQYAAGRTELNSAYGARIYLVNMELYTQFVAYRLLHDLLLSERIRLQPAATQPTER